MQHVCGGSVFGRGFVCNVFAVVVRPLPLCLAYALSFFWAGCCMQHFCGASATVVALIGLCSSIFLGRNIICNTFAVVVRPLPRSLAYALHFFRLARSM